MGFAKIIYFRVVMNSSLSTPFELFNDFIIRGLFVQQNSIFYQCPRYLLSLIEATGRRPRLNCADGAEHRGILHVPCPRYDR